jgi:hypothetical protein
MHGLDFDAIADYETEYERSDPSVGVGESMTVRLVRLVTKGGCVVDLERLDPKEKQRIEDRLADYETECMATKDERRQAAIEDAWDAKRKGE